MVIGPDGVFRLPLLSILTWWKICPKLVLGRFWNDKFLKMAIVFMMPELKVGRHFDHFVPTLQCVFGRFSRAQSLVLGRKTCPKLVLGRFQISALQIL